MQLAEAQNLQDRYLVAQLHEAIRCLNLFDRQVSNSWLVSSQYSREKTYAFIFHFLGEVTSLLLEESFCVISPPPLPTQAFYWEATLGGLPHLWSSSIPVLFLSKFFHSRARHVNLTFFYIYRLFVKKDHMKLLKDWPCINFTE